MTKLTDILDEKSKGLWANIHAKRKRGGKPAKKGSKQYKKTAAAVRKLQKEAERVARKKGQKKGSKKHSDLYTDEDPKGTFLIGLPGGLFAVNLKKKFAFQITSGSRTYLDAQDKLKANVDVGGTNMAPDYSKWRHLLDR